MTHTKWPVTSKQHSSAEKLTLETSHSTELQILSHNQTLYVIVV